MNAPGYTPRTSGLLQGSGGLRQRRKGRTAFGGIRLGDHKRIREEVPDIEEDAKYSEAELLLLAEKILIEDSRGVKDEPAILLVPHMRHRQAHEVYTAQGVPDPSIVQGMYWRTHPNGRAFRTDAEGKAENGFYRMKTL